MEKWLQSKPNPYGKPFVRRTAVRKPFPKNNSAHYGMPNQLFKDSDKDRVPNVFDCKPHNKKKQDVMAPGFGSGITEMYQRQLNTKRAKEYAKYLADLKRQEEERLAELRRIAGETTTIIQPGTNTTIYSYITLDPLTGEPVEIPNMTGREPKSAPQSYKTKETRYVIGGGAPKPNFNTGVKTTSTGSMQLTNKEKAQTSTPIVGGIVGQIINKLKGGKKK